MSRKRGMPTTLSRLVTVIGAAAILAGMAALLATGCNRPKASSSDVIARVGTRPVTRADLEAAAGVPADSLTPEERTSVLAGVIERTLVLQEGERRNYSHDPGVQARLNAVRADLYLSKLLADLPAAPPADTAIEGYYERHQQEFLRPTDSYLIELYWGEDQGVMNRFRDRLVRGDTTLIATGDVSAEGRWLAGSGELEPEFERELSSLTPGEMTFPRPYEDGWRVARLIEAYPAGTVLDLSAVRDEIAERLAIVESHRRQDALMSTLRERYPVRVVGDSL